MAGGDDASAWNGFERALRVERVGETAFEGRCWPGRGDRIFGGHVAAHAVVAAATQSGRDLVPLSVHVHFLRAGDANARVRYEVVRLHSGRTFEHWRVDALQGEALIATNVVVLHLVEGGPRHALADPDPESPEPLPQITDQPREGTSGQIRVGFDMRRGRHWTPADGDRVPYQRLWLRCLEPLPDDPVLRAAVLVWSSDLELVWAADQPYLGRIRKRQAASLDHVVHLHHAIDPGQWWLYVQESPSVEQGRAFVQGRVFVSGLLAASVSQEALLRLELDEDPLHQ